MKRKGWIVALLCICILKYGYYTIPEYQIKSSMSFENGLERQTILKAVVYRNHHDEKLPNKIEEFFVKLNGCPTELQIELYFEGCSEPYKIVNFEY